MLSQIAIRSRDCEVLNVKKFLSTILMLALLAALPTAALADIRRGDRGEDVKELQTLMFELGWLFEEPDGIFGNRTEAAVIALRKHLLKI